MISIVTAYYNRKKLFYRTLSKLKNSHQSDFEVLAIDDGSADGARLEDLQTEFPFLRVIRLNKKDKWYRNPCIPFNIGFRSARGEKIIIQNPECLHFGDIIGYVRNNLHPNDYLSFSCYSLDQPTTSCLDEIPLIDEEISKIFKPEHRFAEFDGDSGWYNHPVLRPAGYHFCSALNKKDLEDLGGFDERYALGTAFDDDEFLHRVRKKGMNLKIIERPMVLHQFHYTRKFTDYSGSYLFKRNRLLFEKITVPEKNWAANKGKNGIGILRVQFFFDSVKDKLYRFFYVPIKSVAKAILGKNRQKGPVKE